LTSAYESQRAHDVSNLAARMALQKHPAICTFAHAQATVFVVVHRTLRRPLPGFTGFLKILQAGKDALNGASWPRSRGGWSGFSIGLGGGNRGRMLRWSQDTLMKGLQFNGPFFNG